MVVQTFFSGLTYIIELICYYKRMQSIINYILILSFNFVYTHTTDSPFTKAHNHHFVYFILAPVSPILFASHYNKPFGSAIGDRESVQTYNFKRQRFANPFGVCHLTAHTCVMNATIIPYVEHHIHHTHINQTIDWVHLQTNHTFIISDTRRQSMNINARTPPIRTNTLWGRNSIESSSGKRTYGGGGRGIYWMAQKNMLINLSGSPLFQASASHTH